MPEDGDKSFAILSEPQGNLCIFVVIFARVKSEALCKFEVEFVSFLFFFLSFSVYVLHIEVGCFQKRWLIFVVFWGKTRF